MTSKPKLIPIRVPWQVSPSVPALELFVSEVEAPTRVSANVNFLNDGFGRMERVVVSFGRSVHARFMPSWSDKEVVREVDYDWSAVPAHSGVADPNENPFLQRWREQGTCPDSGFYEVGNSNWLLEVNTRRPLRHFLILGHDAYIEVLAKDWEWTSGD